MNRARRSVAAAAAAIALVLVPTVAWADYEVTGTVSGRTYQGASGLSGVHKTYTMNAGGKSFCIRSSSLSSNDPVDASGYTRIFVRSGANQRFGGFADVVNGRSVTVRVNESASPAMCQGKKLAYMVWVNV
ncbi:hypothetical protein [Cellulomonas sp. HD19AZ1]|uniref:hypothetical protein n=1 Tax=Cellulomonas TaxID=1707 RepID=UPI00107073F3|nr:hypothetical protein [Cellulomonas sp. HD19AZ1]TFH74334.1 hypothetical protein E4A51_02525 [Cellulomonas sp. HD19AZ1]